ncbi:hypothetical protein PM082_018888 [Marasmius tenuissimus]|nr:hypothetical protein PM082_018888 [Marasmius tenuissimus]
MSFPASNFGSFHSLPSELRPTFSHAPSPAIAPHLTLHNPGTTEREYLPPSGPVGMSQKSYVYDPIAMTETVVRSPEVPYFSLSRARETHSGYRVPAKRVALITLEAILYHLEQPYGVRLAQKLGMSPRIAHSSAYGNLKNAYANLERHNNGVEFDRLDGYWRMGNAYFATPKMVKKALDKGEMPPMLVLKAIDASDAVVIVDSRSY